jgi:hypothetical protein
VPGGGGGGRAAADAVDAVDYERRHSRTPWTGQTPFLLACASANPALVEYLLAWHAERPSEAVAEAEGDVEADDACMPAGVPGCMRDRDADGQGCLHYAAQGGSAATLELLLPLLRTRCLGGRSDAGEGAGGGGEAAGRDRGSAAYLRVLQRETAYGYTPFLVACHRANLRGAQLLACEVAAAAPDSPACLLSRTHDDASALILAVKGGDPAVVAFVLECMARAKRAPGAALAGGQERRQQDGAQSPSVLCIDWTDRSTRTALMWACRLDRIAIIPVLLRWGADPHRVLAEHRKALVAGWLAFCADPQATPGTVCARVHYTQAV